MANPVAAEIVLSERARHFGAMGQASEKCSVARPAVPRRTGLC